MAAGMKWDGWPEMQRKFRKLAASYGTDGERCAG